MSNLNVFGILTKQQRYLAKYPFDYHYLLIRTPVDAGV